MRRYLSSDDVRSMLKRACIVAGTQRALAPTIGVSEQFLSDVVRGKREPSGEILRYLQLERVVSYRSSQS